MGLLTSGLNKRGRLYFESESVLRSLKFWVSLCESDDIQLKATQVHTAVEKLIKAFSCFGEIKRTLYCAHNKAYSKWA